MTKGRLREGCSCPGPHVQKCSGVFNFILCKCS